MHPRVLRARTRRREALDLAGWLLLAAAGLAVTALAVRWGARLGTASAPFVGHYRCKLDAGTLLAPLVAAAVLLATARGLTDRLKWRILLLAGYLAALAWTLALAMVEGGNGLAGPVINTSEYLPDVAVVNDHPGEFLATFVARSADHAIATRQHPPGPVLLLWAWRQLGLHRPLLIGLLVTVIGCLTVPLVLVAVRSLCDEVSARRLAPVLALAPYAVWVAVSMDSITATLSAAMVAAGVLASEQHRRGPPAVGWAVVSGLLLGVAALFSYAAPWLGLSVICVYFVRRRAMLNAVTGAAALVPLVLAKLAGFGWKDGLTAAQTDFSVRVEPTRSAVLWGCLSVVVLVLAAGPAIVASARKVRRTPGWPFLVGATVAVGFAVAAGLARGEMEHAWLPYFPWLLVAAVAPERRGGRPAPTPLWMAGAGALVAVTIEAVLRTGW